MTDWPPLNELDYDSSTLLRLRQVHRLEGMTNEEYDAAVNNVAPERKEGDIKAMVRLTSLRLKLAHLTVALHEAMIAALEIHGFVGDAEVTIGDVLDSMPEEWSPTFLTDAVIEELPSIREP